MSAGFQFESTWAVPCSRSDLWCHVDQLLESDDPLMWWPSVRSTGSVPGRLALRARSRFGYSLDFRLNHLQFDRPERMRFAAEGDLAGRGVIDFVDSGPDQSAMVIDWQVDTSRTWMRRTRWVLHPIFVLAHHRVMREGERRFSAWVREQPPRDA